MKRPVDSTIHELLNQKLSAIEKGFNSDVITYYGAIVDGIENFLLERIEEIAKSKNKKHTLSIILTTTGGSAIAVERYVNIIRKHYTIVNFIIPDYAYSAGTIFCLSGDNIYMDYFSVLGPIDPQVQNKDGNWVPALGYLDKVNEMIAKAKEENLTQAEFLILREIDLAELRKYEQAKELTIDLLKKWLVKYKFKNWNTHETNKELIGQEVTLQQKTTRASEIADALSDNKRWKSHSRPINIQTMREDLNLKIEDLGDKPGEHILIRQYYNLLSDYLTQTKQNHFIHTREFIL